MILFTGLCCATTASSGARSTCCSKYDDRVGHGFLVKIRPFETFCTFQINCTLRLVYDNDIRKCPKTGHKLIMN